MVNCMICWDDGIIYQLEMSDFILSADFISKALLNPLEDERCQHLHPHSCNSKAV
jgi:hypothetical protein